VVTFTAEQRDIEDIGRRCRISVGFDIMDAMARGTAGGEWIVISRRLAMEGSRVLDRLVIVARGTVRSRSYVTVWERQPSVALGAKDTGPAMQRGVVLLARDYVSRRILLAGEQGFLLVAHQARVVPLGAGGSRYQ
jgi:hypothetical protein